MNSRRLVAKSGAILPLENFPKNRFAISTVESLVLSTTSGSPPMAFSISSDNQVFRPFLYANSQLNYVMALLEH